MSTKLLENNIVRFLLIIGIVAGIWAAIHFFGKDKKTAYEDDEHLSNDNYVRLKNRIETYQETDKLNFIDYNSIVSDIRISCEDDKLIDEEQQEILQQNLNSVQLDLLSDSVVNFCRYVDDLNTKKAEELENTLTQFEDDSNIATTVNNMKSLIEKYKELTGAYWSATSYYQKKPYKKQTFKYYENLIRRFKIEEQYFRDNEKLNKKTQYCLEKLQEHAGIDINFEQQSNKYSCECEKDFKGFQFYIDTCKAIQKKRDEM